MRDIDEFIYSLPESYVEIAIALLEQENRAQDARKEGAQHGASLNGHFEPEERF